VLSAEVAWIQGLLGSICQQLSCMQHHCMLISKVQWTDDDSGPQSSAHTAGWKSFAVSGCVSCLLP
jgi:hypothetical protein